MKRIMVVILTVVLLASVFAGCASKTSEEARGYDSSADYQGETSQTDNYLKEGAPVPAPEAAGAYYEDGGGVYEEGRKAIKTAEAQVEVLDFETAFETIKSMLGDNGYIEESNVWKTPAYYNGEKIMLTNGTIRLRIKEENFMGFTEGLSSIGTVLSSRSYEDDISDIYYDTEARLGLLKDEKARLEDYAKKVDDPEIFFQTQSRITQVIYEMENLQGTLKKWDSKVAYSTVSITITEKHPGEESALEKPKGFFERIWDNMKDSVGFMGDVVVFLFGILPVILMLGAFALIVIVIARKASGKRKKDIENK
ncbi:MAG: DUF4349 domain-containing protein [Clostridia bacterium]|nr:DUF4349 domain-containing protein [Clostridia bacterium]